MNGRLLCFIVTAGLLTLWGHGQQPLELDTSFRIRAEEKGVSSLLLTEDGKVIVSGGIKWPGEFFFESLIRLNPDGSKDETFNNSALGGSKLTAWEDRFYVETNTMVRRILYSGHQDPTFISMNSDPLFSSLQGGDFHVYADGRVLLSGAHSLYDSTRGFTGLYNLIWFTNTGHLDTTKTHRRSNGVTDEIEPLPNGQFLVFGNGTQYENQPVHRVFRIHADGSLDPSLVSRVSGGAVSNFLPLPDGRFYAGGIFIRDDDLNDTLRLARFLPNGDLDPTFNNHIPMTTTNPTGFGGIGPAASKLQFWNNGSILAMGNFQAVDGEPRNGICVIDSTGQLQPEFDGCGIGTYYYQGQPQASVTGFTETEDGMAYVYGYYHGYNDGLTNDTLQRFVTRLYGPDFTTGVEESTEQHGLEIYPNPASHTLRCVVPNGTSTQMARLIVHDVSGRSLLTHSVNGDQVELDVSGLANGVYLLELLDGHTRRSVQRFVVQH